MTKITELVARYKAGTLEFDALLEIVPTLQWGTRHEGPDGEIWWDGENTVGDVDVLWYENAINDDERKAIFAAIP